MALAESTIISLVSVGITITVLGLVIGLSLNENCYDVKDPGVTVVTYSGEPLTTQIGNATQTVGGATI
jgi:hypothetical protein